MTQGEWHVAGYARYRACNCTDGNHRRWVDADETCALLNAQQAELEQLRARAALAASILKEHCPACREGQPQKFTNDHWRFAKHVCTFEQAKVWGMPFFDDGQFVFCGAREQRVIDALDTLPPVSQGGD